MKLSPAAPLSLSLLLLLLLSATTSAHNITKILAKHPEFSTFNHYLTVTHLAAEINRRQTITVCAIDNAAMNELLEKHLPTYTLKNVLSLHVFADYFGAKKLHQITKGSTLTATMFQATGEAPGTSGYINITNMKGGKVGFANEDNDGHFAATFVKTVLEMPYNISVIQISHILTSAAAEAPVAAPSDLNVTTLMSKQGCKAFSDLLKSHPDVSKTFAENVESGLTVFCPTDGVLNGFMPKFKNLTKDGQASLLLYHGVPVYNSLGMLKSNNGLMNTLATEGKNKYDFTVQNDGDDVMLKTKVVTATISGTLYDEEPLSVYKIDKVLMPRELFKAVAEEPAPAPKGSKKKKSKKGGGDDVEDDSAPEPSPEDDDAPADESENLNGAISVKNSGWLVTVVLSVICVAFI
ncbi:fasciclin-like arabinogalactan protein 2 [Nicotiana tomentosiformis]|uniref:fasciclin-like arabinogalactan protein 2 n=1 Tax=Nicotiana tomentosiformis TaxID=4098 RepID=UPI00051B45CE|nr:fasciclin-like arabinogalactan protein 2 [Nicotiana tomentosiformis]